MVPWAFWAALDEAFPKTRHPRYWVHKTADVLNKLPKSLQKAAKSRAPRDLHGANNNRRRGSVRSLRGGLPGKVREGAVDCISKDREALLSF